MFKKIIKAFRFFKLCFYIIKSNNKIKVESPKVVQLDRYTSLTCSYNGSIKFIGKFNCR